MDDGAVDKIERDDLQHMACKVGEAVHADVEREEQFRDDRDDDGGRQQSHHGGVEGIPLRPEENEGGRKDPGDRVFTRSFEGRQPGALDETVGKERPDKDG